MTRTTFAAGHVQRPPERSQQMRTIDPPQDADVPEVLAEDLEEVRGLPVHVARSEVGDVHAVVRLALEQRVPVEVLERLVALQERVTDREAERYARASFIAALAAFQSECPPIRKSEAAKITTRKGGQYSYTFAPLEEIARTIRPLIHRHGLSYSWDSTVEGDRVTVVCTLRHIEGHAETAQFVCPTDTEASMSGAQKFAAALTFGRRQSLIQVLGLTSADDDPDGVSGHPMPESDDRITQAQAADLRALMQEVKADEARFLKWAKVPSVEAIPAARYAEAVAALEQKRRAS